MTDAQLKAKALPRKPFFVFLSRIDIGIRNEDTMRIPIYLASFPFFHPARVLPVKDQSVRIHLRTLRTLIEFHKSFSAVPRPAPTDTRRMPYVVICTLQRLDI